MLLLTISGTEMAIFWQNFLSSRGKYVCTCDIEINGDVAISVKLAFQVKENEGLYRAS